MVSVLQDSSSASLLLAPSSDSAGGSAPAPRASPPDPPGDDSDSSPTMTVRPKLRIAKKLGRKLRNNYNSTAAPAPTSTATTVKKAPKSTTTTTSSTIAMNGYSIPKGGTGDQEAGKLTQAARGARSASPPFPGCDKSVDATVDTTLSTPTPGRDKRPYVVGITSSLSEGSSRDSNAGNDGGGISVPAALGLPPGDASGTPSEAADREEAAAADNEDDDDSVGSMSRLVDIFGAALAATTEAARKDHEKEEAEAAAKAKMESNSRRGPGPVDLDDTIDTTLLLGGEDATPSSLSLQLGNESTLEAILDDYDDGGEASGGEESLLDASLGNDDVEVSFEQFAETMGEDAENDESHEYGHDDDDQIYDDVFDDKDNHETSFDSCVKEFTLDESIDEGDEGGGPEAAAQRPAAATAAAAPRQKKKNIMDMDENIPDDELMNYGSMGEIDELIGTRGKASSKDWVAFDSSGEGAALFTDGRIGNTIQAWPPAVTPPVTPSRAAPHPATATYTSLSNSISPVRPSTPSLPPQQVPETVPSRAAAAAALAAARAVSADAVGGEDYIDEDPDIFVGLDETNGDDGDALPSSSGPATTKSVSDDDEGEEDVHTIPSISTTTDDTHQTNNKSPCRPGMLMSTPQRPPRGISSPVRRSSPSHSGVGQSPGRFEFGKRLVDDDSATILTDEGSYLFSTPQRKDKNKEHAYAVPLPSPPPSANAAGKDESFESQNVLDVTSETITINNKSINTSGGRFNESYTNLGTVGSDIHTVGSETLQTVDDHDLGSPVSVNDSDASFVVQHNTKAGSRAIPGVSGHTNKEVCAMFHQVEEFFDEVAADLQYSMKDINRKLDYMCVGDDEVNGGRRLDCHRVRSTVSRRRNGSKRERLEKIMEKRGTAMRDYVDGSSRTKPQASNQGSAVVKQQWSEDNFAH